ncbi:MAG: nucleotidyl transferase AbiEii/AbiGii toxin family protein [Myxococcaceae bacterium]
MNGPGTSFEATLRVAEQALGVLGKHRIDAVVIGAMALAVHHYPRETEDLDLAIAVGPTELPGLVKEFRELGWAVELREPDSNDPLGGVIDIRAPGADLVQIVNFDNPPAGGFPRLVREAAQSALPLAAGSGLRVADLHTLIAFKLYAGGAKSKLDIMELLDRNQPVDMEALRKRCEFLGLGKKLERVLEFARET